MGRLLWKVDVLTQDAGTALGHSTTECFAPRLAMLTPGFHSLPNPHATRFLNFFGI